MLILQFFSKVVFFFFIDIYFVFFNFDKMIFFGNFNRLGRLKMLMYNVFYGVLVNLFLRQNY